LVWENNQTTETFACLNFNCCALLGYVYGNVLQTTAVIGIATAFFLIELLWSSIYAVSLLSLPKNKAAKAQKIAIYEYLCLALVVALIVTACCLAFIYKKPVN